MKNAKKTKIFNVLVPIVLICLITVLIVSNLNGFKIFYYDTKYNINNSSENLTKLCLSLKSSKHYHTIIKYYPKLIDNEANLGSVKKYLKPGADINKAHDELQCIFLFSYFYLGQYQTFKEKYLEYYPQFKEIGYQNSYISTVALDKNTDEKKLHFLLETLQANYPNLEDKPLDEVSNLNVQSIIYQRLGDSENERIAEQKSQEITTSLKK